jgi:2-methylcitrate dehydratase PrpD
VSVNVALGRLLGFEHYERGWHATSTIGPLAAAAAGCHLLALDERSSRSALALAAGQAGGLQRNFGSMAKPVQAGNAAAAAVRAVLLAADGVTGDSDIFGEKGVGSLYGADRKDIGTLCPSDVRSLSLKLYPCCFAAHRLIGAALDARAQLGPHADLGSIARIRLSVPFETMRPLRVTDPRTGDEARFCAAYVLATALLQGQVRFADFANEAIHRAQVRALMARITIVDDSDSGRRPAGLDSGEVHLVLEGPGMRAEAYCAVFPGSPQAPPSVEQFDAKIADCAAVYAASARVMFGLSDVRRKVRNLVGDLRSPPA